MNFIFTGFTQANAIRQFGFDCVADDRTRTSLTVRADLTLARKHKISMQELPLLCRRLLEQSKEAVSPASMTFTEEDMKAVESAATEAVAKRKMPRRVTPPGLAGRAWR